MKLTRFEDFGKETTPATAASTNAPQIEEEFDFSPELNDAEELDEKADPLVVTSKDTMRIKDIMDKAHGNMYKAKSLAETMCKLIKDKWKAMRRARAAEREGQSELADIFFARAKELGGMGA